MGNSFNKATWNRGASLTPADAFSFCYHLISPWPWPLLHSYTWLLYNWDLHSWVTTVHSMLIWMFSVGDSIHITQMLFQNCFFSFAKIRKIYKPRVQAPSSSCSRSTFRWKQRNICRLLTALDFLTVWRALYIAVFSLQERCRSISLVTGATKSVTPQGHTPLAWTSYMHRITEKFILEVVSGSPSPTSCSKQDSYHIYSWILKVSKDGDVTAFLDHLFMSGQSEFFFLIWPSLVACESVISCFTPVHLWEGSGSVSVTPCLF